MENVQERLEEQIKISNNAKLREYQEVIIT